MPPAPEPQPTSALVVGIGSVGRRHARRLADRGLRLVVVDPSPDARRWAQAQLPADTVTASTLAEALGTMGAEAASAIGVIANWGPDHAPTFHALVDAGFRRVLCEKPLANSPAAARAMAQRAEREGVTMTFGTYLRYTGVAAFLRQQLEAHAGGPPVMVAVHGGAQCLVTNGIHLLDLACALFDAEPTAVWSDAVDGRLNPRSPDLGFWAGTAVWSFPNGRSATITLTNASSVASAMHVYGPAGRVDLAYPLADAGAITVGARDPREIARDPRVTRTGELTLLKTFVRGAAPERDGTDVQLDELTGAAPPSYPPARAAAVLEALLAALASSAEGRRIDLPLSPDDPAFERAWPAS